MFTLQKKRCKAKSLDKVETLKAFDPSALLTNGDPKFNSFHPCLPAPPSSTRPLPLPPPPPPPPPLPPPPSTPQEGPLLPRRASKEFPSETSSCSSSTHSEESYASRLPPPSPVFPADGVCNGHGLSFPLSQPVAKSRQEKRSTKRRKSRQTELQFPHMPVGSVGSLPSLQQLMKGNKEMSVGTIGVTAVTGHVWILTRHLYTIICSHLCTHYTVADMTDRRGLTTTQRTTFPMSTQAHRGTELAMAAVAQHHSVLIHSCQRPVYGYVPLYLF